MSRFEINKNTILNEVEVKILLKWGSAEVFYVAIKKNSDRGDISVF